jgi:pimeloyl-ACP methyl ester carboxylesterase/DNA-binding CsgD family transcriptional regulator
MSEAELIERIYNIALEPHSYGDFMEKWDHYFSEALDKLAALKMASEAEDAIRLENLSRHFEMGFRLLEELGRTTPATYFAGNAPGTAAASVLIDRNGQVVWYNGAASRYFGLRRISNIGELPLWDRSRAKLNDLVAQLAFDEHAQADKTVLRMHSKPADKTLFMVADIVRDGSDEPLVLISQVISAWQNSVGRMLSESFGLTSAETQIAECLVEGAAIPEIAERRSSTVNTVRTQVKALLAKTGVSTQTELVRLLVSLNNAAQKASPGRNHVGRGQPFSFRQRDGRTMPYHHFGPEKGKPFIFLHGMLDGCDLTPAMIDVLHQHDIALIAPERPFFGSAAGVDADVRTAPERLALDIEDLLDHLSIGEAGLLGHMAGAVYAFAAGAHLGDRASSIVCVSGGVPIVSNDQFASMSSRQRLVAYTARYTPKLLPFVLRAGIRELDFGGEESFMRALYKNSPHDLKAITDEAISSIICSGYHFTTTQGHRAFEIDSYHVVRDWTWRAEQTEVPVILIHGRHDPVVCCDSVEKFADRLGQRAKLVVDDDAGQMLFYQNPQLIMSMLAALN